MLLTVFSDSHGRPGGMRRAVERFRPAQVVFLGDGARDAEEVSDMFPDIPFLILRGNCDWNDALHQESALFELGGVRIFAAHGHRHGVKTGLEAFANSVHCAGARLGLYGHTHLARVHDMGEFRLMNPGSVGDRVSPTFGLVRIENGDIDCQILEIGKDF